MWNYSYSFEQETQLASWEVLGRESNGAAAARWAGKDAFDDFSGQRAFVS